MLLREVPLKEIRGRQSVVHSFLDTYAGESEFLEKAISAETKLTD